MKAQDFRLPDQDGVVHTLAQYRGTWVVVYFYPKDDTPGCTTEACSFRDSIGELTKLGVVIMGISKDSVASHKRFAGKYHLNFTLLSDPSGETIKAYGARGGLGTLRKTHLIDPKGEIAKVYEKVNPTRHAGEILRDIRLAKKNNIRMMRNLLIRGAILCVVLAGAYYILKPYMDYRVTMYAPKTKVAASMKLTSPAFENNQKIPPLYTCDGKRIHPPFDIAGVPQGAKYLALIVDDPDAPSGTFTHWVIWNIHADVAFIEEGVVPQESQEGTSSSGRTGFVAPCPPAGEHRYFFTLYALDKKLGIDGKGTKADLESAMAGHVMAQSLLVGRYGR